MLACVLIGHAECFPGSEMSLCSHEPVALSGKPEKVHNLSRSQDVCMVEQLGEKHSSFDRQAEQRP
jgi:hypothetical protein